MKKIKNFIKNYKIALTACVLMAGLSFGLFFVLGQGTSTSIGHNTNIGGDLSVDGNITANTSPTADNHVTTKEYVAAQVGGAGAPALGTDMLNQYFMQEGLFTPHSDNCGVDEAFVEIASGSAVGFCIEEDERTAAYWEYAKKTCADDGKRLPEPWEWKYACKNATTLGLNNMTNNWEWASNFSLPMYDGTNSRVAAAVFGGGGCYYANIGNIGRNDGAEGSRAFRCVR